MPVLKLSLILVVKAVNSLRRMGSPLGDLAPFREVNLNSLGNSLGGEHLYISVEIVHGCEAKWCWKSLAEFLVNIFIFYFTALKLYFHYPISLPTRSIILQIYFSTSKLLIFRRDLLFECFSFCLHLLLESLSVFCQQLPTFLECLSLSFCSRNRCLKLIKFLCKFALLFFILFPTTLFLYWFWKDLCSTSLRFCFRYFFFGI